MLHTRKRALLLFVTSYKIKYCGYFPPNFISMQSDTYELFARQRSLVVQFFDDFDPSQADSFVNLLQQGEGTVLFTGVGKSGFICAKAAATFASLGIRSSFLNPLDALHGDIGTVCDNDIVVILSKSGSSEELLKLVPCLRLKGAKIVSVTCSTHNTLSSLCDVQICLPLSQELCVFNAAPVTSTVVQLIFFDTVAACLMRRRQLSLEQYAMNHPAGSIGRRLTWRVKDIMLGQKAMPVVSQFAKLSEAILQMSTYGVGCVIACDGGNLVGIFTDGDLRRLITNGLFDLEESLAKFVNRNIRTIKECIKLTEAQLIFRTPTLVSVLPVVADAENGAHELVGLLCLADALKALE